MQLVPKRWEVVGGLGIAGDGPGQKNGDSEQWNIFLSWQLISGSPSPSPSKKPIKTIKQRKKKRRVHGEVKYQIRAMSSFRRAGHKFPLLTVGVSEVHLPYWQARQGVIRNNHRMLGQRCMFLLLRCVSHPGATPVDDEENLLTGRADSQIQRGEQLKLIRDRAVGDGRGEVR